MRVIVECSDNIAHHLHISPLINKLIDCGFSVYAFRLNEDVKFKDIPDIKYITLKNNPFSLRLLNVKNINFFLKVFMKKILKNESPYKSPSYRQYVSGVNFDYDVIIYTNLIDGSYVKDINNKIKVVWALHGPVANKFARGNNSKAVDLILSPGVSTNKYMNCIDAPIVGSIKLQEIQKQNNKDVNEIEIFKNNRKTVFFNPHFNKKIGAYSWYKFGFDILDFFKKSKDFNLIFAPHINLKDNIQLDRLEQYYKYDNIHIDIDSDRLTNLFYGKYTDIYLGDVSSQLFEFIALKPRRCILFELDNPSEENLFSYEMCELVSDIDSLVYVLNKEFDINILKVQKEKIKEIFFNADDSSMLAVDNILSLISD